MPVAAVIAGGMPSMSTGSMTAACAAMRAVPPTLNLILRPGSVITAQSVTSLPVPAVVGTVTSGGMRRRMGSCPHSYLAIEPPCAATTPMALATSMGEPPPTATSPSQPSAA